MGLKQVKYSWNAFGLIDPFWYILTFPEKKDNGWEPKEFYDTGKAQIAEILERANALEIDFDRKSALDFGCGVGRLSQALMLHFESVCGVDISLSMLEAARRYNRFDERCSYVFNESTTLPFQDASFDFVLSLLVLQHMKPVYAIAYIKEFLRILKPGGLLVFQLPIKSLTTQAERWWFRAGELMIPPILRRFFWVPLGSRKTPDAASRIPNKKLLWNLNTIIKLGIKQLLPPVLFRFYQSYQRRKLPRRPIMEMHYISEQKVSKLLRANGGQIVQALPDNLAGSNFVSICWYVLKSD